MSVHQYISALARYGIDRGLIQECDRVYAINRLLEALEESNINVDYIYLSFSRDSGKPIMVFHTEDAPEVEECLIMKGFNLVQQES